MHIEPYINLFFNYQLHKKGERGEGRVLTWQGERAVNVFRILAQGSAYFRNFKLGGKKKKERGTLMCKLIESHLVDLCLHPPPQNLQVACPEVYLPESLLCK